MNPLTRRQKIILLILTLLIAASRLVAVSRAPFDWDEGLFSLAVQEYDVAQHQPHPPGYPLFIVAAKLFHLFGLSEFRAVQCVVVLGAMLLFPAIFFLARELGFDFPTSAGGAAVFAFLPNVWVHGGTAFSDVPAAVAGFAACALLLRGRREARAYLLGAVVLGIAVGIRPLNLLLAAVPAVLATFHQLRASWRTVVLALLLGGAIAGGSYAGAAYASESPKRYLEVVRAQSDYVRRIDSWRNPGRPRLRRAARVFFLWPIEMRRHMIGLATLSLLSLISRRRAPWLTVAVFTPVAVMTWLNLDIAASARYAIAYLPTHALLAADGLGMLSRRRAAAQAILCGAVVTILFVWTWPALALQRTQLPPPIAAIEWIRRNTRPEETIYIHGAIWPQGQYLLADRRKSYFDTDDQLSLMAADAYVLDLREVPGARNWVWPRKHLWRVIRHRNFESSVRRVAATVQFGEGFYGAEGVDASPFQWMAGSGKITLPPMTGTGRLSLRLYVPVQSPSIEVWLNRNLLERFAATDTVMEKAWTVPARGDAVNELRITTSATVNPQRLGRGGDARDLGLRVDGLSWMPLR